MRFPPDPTHPTLAPTKATSRCRPVQAADPTYDIAIIGGGINGCGIARDAAGRGWRVLLLEQGDLGGGTSSWSTKLIHGGLRYLEHYEFRLVREALIEREVLWGIAPHIVRPLRFVLPHQRGARPAALLRLGLFLYDHIGGRKLLPGTRTIDLSRDALGEPLAEGLAKRGFEYSDCAVDDTRLVVLNARDAADRGATILTRMRATAARRVAGGWEIDAAPAPTAEGGSATAVPSTYRARTLVNAAGPWVERVLGTLHGAKAKAHVRLVQGSHIVVRRLYAHDRAYIFQNRDGRIFFVIPFEDDFTLIGTTDRDYQGDPGGAFATDEEIAYLIEGANAVLRTKLAKADVVWSFSGVRPLYDDGASAAQEATRDYVLETDAEDGAASLVSVFGGKITTYRRLAEAVLEELEGTLGPASGRPAGWTGAAALPGGDLGIEGQARLAGELLGDHPFLGETRAKRLARSYGSTAREILARLRGANDLGQELGGGLTEREVRHLVDREWARTGEDVLWRRSKLGLRLTLEEKQRVDELVRRLAGGVSVQAAQSKGGP